MKTEGHAMEQTKLKRLNEASDWLLRLESTAHTEEEISEWLRWCDAHPENVEAFENLQRDWHDLDLLKAPASFNNSLRRWRGRVRERTPWRLAASLAAIALTAAAGYYWQTNRAAPRQVIAASTNKAATLPDGSSLVLGARTQVNVDFTGQNRRLDLSDGEAYFKVKHDKRRPFIVKAGPVSVTAVGTAFDVRRENDQVIVTVEEGIVEVSSSSLPGEKPGVPSSPANTWRAEAGYQVIYSSLKHTATIASVNPSSVLKWRNGELAYVWKPLGDVIEDLNRYSSRKIVIEDKKLANLRFTGTVFTASLDDWLKAVQQAYPVHAEENSDGDIVLTAR